MSPSDAAEADDDSPPSTPPPAAPPPPPPAPLLSLPDDILGLISASLSPPDLCSLILTCRSLRAALSTSDKAWLPQCARLLSTAQPHLLRPWRTLLPSYRHLCRFLLAVRPLLGAVWVHQNPELGNVVCVVPGFLSVVACRVIPQELGPMGLHRSPLLYTPVFEIVADRDGSVAGFFLYGREEASKEDTMCPGEVRAIDPNCNVLYLEAEEPMSAAASASASASAAVTNSRVSMQQQAHLGKRLWHSKSTVSAPATTSSSSSSSSPSSSGASDGSPSPPSRRLCRSDTTIPRLPAHPPPTFARLAFGDRRKLLELLTAKVKVPQDLSNSTPFLHPDCADDANHTDHLADRWNALLHLLKAGPRCVDKKQARSALDLADSTAGGGAKAAADSSCGDSEPKRRSSLTSSFRGYWKSIILGKPTSGSSSSCSSSSSSTSSSSSDSKHVPLHDFLRSRDAVGLSLRAASVKLTTYRAWPNMHDNRFALYKLPLHPPSASTELAGLWAGTFGWPPGQPSDDKQAKALFLLLLSYDKLQGATRPTTLLATKILEGTHYVLHPNGSAMFTVNIDDPSDEPFPWHTDADGRHVDVRQAYSGEGIANGYGFRYPGSKPGSLYLLQDGQLLAFVWTESRAVLTLQRLDLQELIVRGEMVPAPPPISNFVYLTKSYSNVFAGYASNSASSGNKAPSAARAPAGEYEHCQSA